MTHGKTERETLDLNGWTIGDILEGDEGYGPHLIVITAVGEERFLCRWNFQKGKGWERESGQTTLTCRKWRKVSSVNAERIQGGAGLQNQPKMHTPLDGASCSSLVASLCWCGGKAKVRGRTLECSNRKCGSLVMKKTRNESIVRWNEIMKTNSQAQSAAEFTDATCSKSTHG